MPVTENQILETYHRIKGHIRKTPLVYAPLLSEQIGANVHLKLENWQLSGSFKIRGVMSKVLSYPEEIRRKKRFVAVSTGNHAIAFTETVQKFGIEGEVFLPETVSPAKLKLIQSLKIPYRTYGQDGLETELYARNYAKEKDYVFVSPYNDEAIVAGQGTIGVEIANQISTVDKIIVPVGGGGMISGIGVYLKSKMPNVQIIGSQPENSPEMTVSLEKGYIIQELISKPTLSDGTAGGIEPDSITFEYCKKYVDRFVLLSEKEIGRAVHWILQYRQMMIEGAAGLSIATLFKEKESLQGQDIVCVLCGRRLSYDKLKKIISQHG